MLALRSHVAEAAGASSSERRRAPPSLEQDRSASPSGAQSRRQRHVGDARLAKAFFSLTSRGPGARRLLAWGPLGRRVRRDRVFFLGEGFPCR